MKKLSIITICYNEPNLAKTCESIMNQSWQDFEWIVIDGGSNDETLAIFDKYKSRIDKFVSEPDNGRYDAMNKGIRLASGEYLNFMNAGDSYFYNDVLKDIFADKTYEAGVLYGNWYAYGDNHRDGYILALPLKLTKEFLYTNHIGHQSSFIHKSLFDKYGLYDDKLIIAGDYEKWFVFIANDVTFKYIPYIVACFDLSGISSTDESRDFQHKERLKIVEAHCSKTELTMLKKKYKKMFRPQYYSFWEQIFSVKNMNDGNNCKVKVITILGLRFKIKKTNSLKLN